MNDNINTHLEKINVWLKLNKLTVNVSKTKCKIFHKRRNTPQLDLLLNNIKIEQVSTFTFLGIILDTSLVSWKHHTKMIAIKISKIIDILHKLKYIFSERNTINFIQITNCATFELWSPIMGSKS